jgi:hypothetical protein
MVTVGVLDQLPVGSSERVTAYARAEDMTISLALIIHFTEAAHRWKEEIRSEIGASVLIID